MFFLCRYCKLLEETSFRGRTADFFFMLLFGGGLLTLAAPFVNIQFLGSSLTFMMVSVRRLIRENCSQMDVGEVHRSHSMAYAGLRLGQT